MCIINLLQRVVDLLSNGNAPSLFSGHAPSLSCIHAPSNQRASPDDNHLSFSQSTAIFSTSQSNGFYSSASPGERFKSTLQRLKKNSARTLLFRTLLNYACQENDNNVYVTDFYETEEDITLHPNPDVITTLIEVGLEMDGKCKDHGTPLQTAASRVTSIIMRENELGNEILGRAI